MKEEIGAYRNITDTKECKELVRLRFFARHNEASALGHARREEWEKWQKVVAERDATLADLEAEIARLRAKIDESK